MSFAARTRALALASLCVATALPASSTTSAQSAPAPAGMAPVMTMFVPLAEQEISDGLFSIYPAGTPTDIVSTIAITSSAADSIIYWDHWEDGYEADLTSATAATTEVWGDGIASNGMLPGAVDAADDVIEVGEVIFLQDTVTLPRAPGDVFFDGRDKVASTRGFSMTRAGWDAGIGTGHAGAVAVTDTSKFGTQFDIPIGEDAGFEAFDYTGLAVMVAADDTVVDVDIGGDGSVDQSTVLDEGESLYLDGGISVGTTVRASGPAQVHLLTGKRRSRWEGRWYEVFPAETLDDEYVAATTSSDAGQAVTVFLYNPNDDPITISADAAGAADDTDIVVAAGTVAPFDLPAGSGAHFSSPGNPFSALSGTVAAVGNTVAYDWGHSLVPVSSLTPSAFVGWGSGGPTGTESNSPVWAAPTAATTIFVDLDNDGTADLTYADVEPYEIVRIVDPDHDLTGARIYTTNGTSLSIAWGQDAALKAGQAYDLGAAVLPTAALITTKNATLGDDVGGDGFVDGGDTLLFTIDNFGASALTLADVVVLDELPDTLRYLPGTATVGGQAVADDVAGTPFPFDEAGGSVGTIEPGGRIVVTFEARVVVGFDPVVDHVANVVTVTADQATSTAKSITTVRPLVPATIDGVVWADVDGDGVRQPSEDTFDDVTVSIVGPTHPDGAVTTTVDGAFGFDDLLPGEHTVSIDRTASTTLPATFTSTTGGDEAVVVVASGATIVGVDFGYDSVPVKAVDDRFATDADVTLIVDEVGNGLLANDERGAAAIEVVGFDVTSAQGGTVVVQPDGTFTYSPADEFVGDDTFTYTIRSRTGAGLVGEPSTAVVRIAVRATAEITGTVWHDRNANGRIDAAEVPFADVEVRAVPDCPVDTDASADAAVAVTAADGSYRLTGLALGCHRVTLVADTLPMRAETSTFDIDGGRDASARVDVSASSGAMRSDVDFGLVNLVPRARPDVATTAEGVAVTIEPLDNDDDPEARELTIATTASSADGSATTDGATITYTPVPGFDGVDWLTYTACDAGGECATATITITVDNTNDPPRIAGTTGTVRIVIGQPVPPIEVVDDEGDDFETRLAAGALPDGVSLNSDGTFDGRVRGTAGTPIAFSVEVCDDRNACATVPFSTTLQPSTTSGRIPDSGGETRPLLALGMIVLALGTLLRLATVVGRPQTGTQS